MKNTKRLGDFGEKIARMFLERKGYKILAQNYRLKQARKEIDIIAADGEYIIFAEVKTSGNPGFATPAEHVGPRKQEAVISAAKGWIYENPGTGLQPRFDVIEVYHDKNTGKNYVRHIENAFIDKGDKGGEL